jgi:lipoate-protein ligase A
MFVASLSLAKARQNMPLKITWLEAAPADASENLRLDEMLLEECNGILRLWECSRECVVLGHWGQPERDVHLDECRRAGVPVLRRCSGGGAVLLGPGCLNYSLVIPLAGRPKFRDVGYSMHWITRRMRRALGVPELRCAEPSDLALHGRKVSGNAQRRARNAILHHGTLLYKLDATRAEMFLKPPVREPPYRAGRTHRDFLGNLPLSANEIRRRLREAWC